MATMNRVKLNINEVFSSDESDYYSSSVSTAKKKLAKHSHSQLSNDSHFICPEGFFLVPPSRYTDIPMNTLTHYVKKSGEIMKGKYFKEYDKFGDKLIFGYYSNNKRNYDDSINNILELYMPSSVTLKTHGGASSSDANLKDTHEIPNDQWKSIARDTIISYQKLDKTWVYRAKFNGIISDNTGKPAKIALTTESGFAYKITPNKIIRIVRHFSNTDKTLTFILTTLKNLEANMMKLDQRLKKLEAKQRNK
jgi:hypothetical protein